MEEPKAAAYTPQIPEGNIISLTPQELNLISGVDFNFPNKFAAISSSIENYFTFLEKNPQKAASYKNTIAAEINNFIINIARIKSNLPEIAKSANSDIKNLYQPIAECLPYLERIIAIFGKFNENNISADNMEEAEELFIQTLPFRQAIGRNLAYQKYREIIKEPDRGKEVSLPAAA